MLEVQVKIVREMKLCKQAYLECISSQYQQKERRLSYKWYDVLAEGNVLQELLKLPRAHFRP